MRQVTGFSQTLPVGAHLRVRPASMGYDLDSMANAAGADTQVRPYIMKHSRDALAHEAPRAMASIAIRGQIDPRI